MPFLPLYDSNPRVNVKLHYVTISLIAVNLFFFIETISSVRIGFGETLIGYTLLPARLFGDLNLPLEAQGFGVVFSLISYQFLHGGWEHLIFNMLFLWVFGDNIEDKLGHKKFIAYYLMCGIAGGVLHSLVNTTSLKPTIGASGAIAGILGGYILLYPRARLLVLAFGFIPVRLPALLVIGAFFAQDLIWGITGTDAIQGVAVWAHIGGFICGATLIFLLDRKSIALFKKV